MPSLGAPMTRAELVFDPYSAEFRADPYTIFRRMRNEAPVYYDRERDFYALTRHHDVAAAYRDFDTYSSTAGIDLDMARSGQTPPPVILFMDPPSHTRMRALVNKAFTPRAIEALGETVNALVKGYLSAIDGRRFDVVQEFASLFPAEVIMSMTGVPRDFREQLRIWYDEVQRYQPGQIEGGQLQMTALLDMVQYFNNLVLERRAHPQPDMISTLIEAEIQRDHDEFAALEDYEIAFFAMMLLGAGVDTVTKLVGSAIAVFDQHPEQWQKLLDDRTKIPAAVEELLRYDGPVLYNLRTTLKEVTVQGVTIPAGRPVLLCGAAANRDSVAFADPDVFDIDRDRSRAQHLALGYGIHSCLGAALARLETTIALEHLLDFMPRYRVVWDECERTQAPNIFGWSRLPVEVLS